MTGTWANVRKNFLGQYSMITQSHLLSHQVWVTSHRYQHPSEWRYVYYLRHFKVWKYKSSTMAWFCVLIHMKFSMKNAYDWLTVKWWWKWEAYDITWNAWNIGTLSLCMNKNRSGSMERVYCMSINTKLLQLSTTWLCKTSRQGYSKSFSSGMKIS